MASIDELGQSSISYQVIRRFVLSKQFESLFELQLLSRILHDIIESCKTAKKSFEPDIEEGKKKGNAEGEKKILEAGPSEDNRTRESGSSEASVSTVPYKDDRTSNLPFCKSSQGDERHGSKEVFFTSDSDNCSSTFSCGESFSGKTAPKKYGLTSEEKTKKSEEKETRKEGSDKFDEEEKELQKLLRMTGISSHTRANPSGVEEKEQKEKKNSKSKEKEISLIDCLEPESGEGVSKPDVEAKENSRNDFFSLVNSQLKKSFLLTSEESCQSSQEEKNEEDEKRKKKKRKKKKKKKNNELGLQTRKKDDLSEFRISDFNSKERSATEATEGSDDSMKCVQDTKKKKLESWNFGLTVDSESDINQGYAKTESSPVKGRKNIKKILKKESLQMETKEALRNEEERKKRVKERQKLFEELFLNGKSRVILDFDPETKEPLVTVHKKLAKKLKPHQVKGVKFMWDNCFESVKRLEEDSGSGCILAHCMGLGKTLQVITLVHTVMTHDLGVNTVLIVCPLSTVSNWTREFRTWQRQCTWKLKPIDLNLCRSKSRRLAKVNMWLREGGVLVISYGMFRSLVRCQKLRIVHGFLDPGPDLVVCDEGHVLKNSSSALTKSMTNIKTLRRIILTGTPLQNSLMEYYCMVQFVKPNILGTVKEFKNRFFHPINNGQFEDSTELDVKIMKRRSHVLHRMLDGFIQRFGYSVLTPFLPEKQEYVISIALTKAQESIYRFFIGQCNHENRELLKDFHFMQKAWTHPWVLLTHSNKQGVEDTLKAQWEAYVQENDYTNIRSSGKLYLLFSILRECKKIGDKILVFSQSLLSLDLIEFFLRKANEENSSGVQAEFADSWVFGEDYFRLDGSTTSENRDAFFQKFNDANNKRFQLFLVSTKAGGLGVSLVAANRVVVFDASWNPTHDVQSIFRVYRFGQKKPCFIYRFLAAATMEEKIYKRQVTKLSLAHRILDEHQIERHYTMGNLLELYTYDPIPKTEWKIPKIPKDGLFAKILSNNLDMIVGYHEHDSLLENKEEEELTEEERRAAWEDYEKEKLVPERLVVMNGTPVSHPFNGENSKTLAWYGQGAPTTPNVIQAVSQREKPLCRIVDVRTLHEEEVQRPEALQEVDRAFGAESLIEETLEMIRKRLDRTAGGFHEGRSERYG